MILFAPRSRGLEVVTCSWVPESERIARSWWERWFTRPWRPFVRTKLVPIPYVIYGDKLLVRPERVEWLQDAIARFNADADAEWLQDAIVRLKADADAGGRP